MLKKFFVNSSFLRNSLIYKLLAVFAVLPAAAFAQDKGTSTLVEALILVAIIMIMAGVPLFRRR